ncbi:MAG: hypothetical protein K6T83_13280 [Alicyclobacillus sp.]|nr:hypothetical protein [Alicyclobacillus sp.]
MPKEWLIITVVGRSIIDRFERDNGVSGVLSGIVTGISDTVSQISLIRRSFVPRVVNWLKEKPTRWIETSCAELQSIVALTKLPAFRDGVLRVRLIAADTIDSYAAALVLQEWSRRNESAHIEFDYQKDIISGLQVEDRSKFSHRGLPTLIRRLSDIIESYPFTQVVMNCTSGFRAVIPYLSAFSLVHRIQMVCQFERSGQLMVIPRLPMELSWSLMEKHYDALLALQRGIEAPVEKLIQTDPYAELDDMGLIESDADMSMLSAMGEILLARYHHLYSIVHVDKAVLRELRRLPPSAVDKLVRILADKFSNYEIRKNRTEMKNNHFVFDDGDNGNRIYFLESPQGIPVVYKVFTDHAEHEWYYERTSPPSPADLVPVRIRISREDGAIEELP